MQSSICEDSIMGLIYMVKFLKDKEQINENDSHFYYNKYGGFTFELNCIGLHIPGVYVCQ